MDFYLAASVRVSFRRGRMEPAISVPKADWKEFPHSRRAPMRYMSATGELISIYENEIPSFVGGEMERLYQNIYSSLPRLTLMGETEGVSTYAVSRNGTITTLFLFRIDNDSVRVLNEYTPLESDEIALFVKTIFSLFPSPRVITFRAIGTNGLRLPYAYQCFNCSEDIVLSLPRSKQEYQANLGKNMRKTINENSNKLKRRFPTFSFQIYEGKEANEELIRRIIRFNRERMLGKNKAPGTEEEEARQILAMVHLCGVVFTITVDDRICAGQVCFRAGENYFSLVNAHSPEFNEYRLGTVCNFLSICECIERGGKEFHFLWGREEFKYRFLGERRDLDELVIYRSPLDMVVRGRQVMQTAIQGRTRQAKLWLLDPKRKDHFAVRFARKMAQRQHDRSC